MKKFAVTNGSLITTWRWFIRLCKVRCSLFPGLVEYFGRLPVFHCVIRKKRRDEWLMLLFHFALNKCLSDLDLECCITLINAILSREEIATSRSCLRIPIIGQEFQHSALAAFSPWITQCRLQERSSLIEGAGWQGTLRSSQTGWEVSQAGVWRC